MKKIFIYTSIIILTIIVVGVIVVETSIVHVQLPHGAVLHVLPAPKDNQKHGAIVLCPGGGYAYLEKWKEGYRWFPFLYAHGYAVAMLEYRLPNQNRQAPMIDGAEAIRLMRKHAKEWNFDENNVGIMGFSAGGHLASTLMVSVKASVRPDFGILFYPVISMKKELTHKGSHDQLLGEKASERLENLYSNELHVSSQTPPAYIAVSIDDQKVNPQNAVKFHDAMLAQKRAVILHAYPSGGHGWKLFHGFPHQDQILDDLAEWLKENNNRKQ